MQLEVLLHGMTKFPTMSTNRPIFAFGILTSKENRSGIGTFHSKSSGLYVIIRTFHMPLPFFLNQQRIDFVNGWKWFHYQNLSFDLRIGIIESH